MEKEQEKARYPRALDDAFFYMFAGYVSKFGKDKIGMRDTITQILIDLGLDPSSPVDRKWASNKFRIANPNNYDPDDKASHRCKQEYYDYYTIQSTIACLQFLRGRKVGSQ